MNQLVMVGGLTIGILALGDGHWFYGAVALSFFFMALDNRIAKR